MVRGECVAEGEKAGMDTVRRVGGITTQHF